jgi:hypothetical protein
MPHYASIYAVQGSMLLLKDECSLCKRVVSSSFLRRCFGCGRLYCFDCTTFTQDGYITCLNCARREVSPRRFGTKNSSLSRYLLRRGKFTDRVALRFGEIEGIMGDNLPLAAGRDQEWWRNSKGRGWTTVGWNVENVDLNNRTVTFIRVAKPQTKQGKKARENKRTEFYKRPLRFPACKRLGPPSKTKIAQVQAKLRNIERQRMANEVQRGKFAPKPAYEKRLFKPNAKPSKTSD